MESEGGCLLCDRCAWKQALAKAGIQMSSSALDLNTRSFSCLPRKSLDCRPTTKEMASIRLDLPARKMGACRLRQSRARVPLRTG
eukprot:scaffold237874_cov27-Tisochrysis_lutea.AAC.4